MATKKAKTVQVKLVKSLIGTKKDQLATAESLGLRKIGDITVQPNNDATKGKIKKIIHLVEVVNAKAFEQGGATP